MPLVKQNIPISFAQGLSTKSDSKQLIPGSLTLLENAVFTEIDKITKRFGYKSLDSSIISGGKISNAQSISTFQNEINLYTDARFYSFSEALQNWIDKGRIFNIVPTSTPILRNAYQQSATQVECVENVSFYAWEDNRGGIRISTLDSDSGNFFLSDVEADATATNPKLVTLFNTFYLFYVDGSDLKYRKMKSFQPTTLDAEVSVLSDFDPTNKLYDIMTLGDRIFITYYSSVGGSELKTFSIDQNGTPSSSFALSETPTNALNISSDVNNRVIITFADTTDLKATAFSFSLGTQIMALTTIETIGSVGNITTIHDNGDDFKIYYEITNADSTKYRVRESSFNIDTTVVSPSDFLRGVGLASHAYTHSDLIYVPVLHDSQFQATYFNVDENKNVVTKISAGLGGEVITKNRLSRLCNFATNKFLFVSQIKGRLISQDNNFFSLLGVNSTIINFNPESQFQDQTLGENLHVSGGILQMYDGKDVVEHGYHIFPEGLTAGTNSASGGSMSDGVFLYAAVYAWFDNKGQLHRSAPSLGLSVTTSAGGSSQTQEIVVPTLRLTSKENAFIELYRTEDQGSIYYKVTDITAPEFNNTAVDSITITDGTSDADLIDNELLYTTGGILENIAAPSSKFIQAFGNRLFLAGLEDPNLIAFSKIRNEDGAAEFSDLLTLRIDPGGGEITALGVMDDKLIIFKKERIFFISGEGPNNAGSLDTFIEPQEIASDVGVTDSNSVVSTPQGLMFKSEKGIYLLTRGLQSVYVGARVEDFNSSKITSATLVSDTNQVRFTTQDNDCIVFDYLINQWSTFTNHRSLDSDLINGQYIYLGLDNRVRKEVKDTFTDDGSPIHIRLETGWLSFAGIQSFKRVYRLMILGEYKSPHILKVRAAYNFNPAFIQEESIDSSTFLDDTRYGNYSPYGEPTTVKYGGNGNVYQAKVNLKTQKCQSIKLRFEEYQTTNLGEGLSLSALTFQVGAKAGLFKNNKSNDFKTE